MLADNNEDGLVTLRVHKTRIRGRLLTKTGWYVIAALMGAIVGWGFFIGGGR